MAITCEICKKKQSGWIHDFSLSPELQEYRICANCHREKENLSKGITEQSAFISAKNYFENIMGNIDSEEVRNYLSSEINAIESSVNKLKQKEHEEAEKRERLKEEKLLESERLKNFKMTNGYNFEGHNIENYIKVLNSEAVIGTGFISEISADFSDFFGTESNAFASKLQEARDIAELKLKKQAMELNANALIGISFEYINFSRNLIGVTITGTAVYID